MKTFKTVLKYAIIAGIFYFIFRNLIENWGKLDNYNVRLNLGIAILSLLTVIVAWIITAYSWKKVFAAFGYVVPFKSIYIIYFKSNLSKYLPGKIWQIASSTYLAKEFGLPEGISFTASLVGQAYSVLSGLALIFGAVILGFTDLGAIGEYIKLPAIVFILLLLLLAMRPELLVKPFNAILKIFKLQKVSLRIKVTDAIELFGLYFVCWLVFGLGLWLFARALTPISFDLFIDLAAINAAAVVIGFLALFAPGGLAVHEGAAALLMAPIASFPNPLPTAIAVGFRIVITISEIIAFGLTWVIKWISKK